MTDSSKVGAALSEPNPWAGNSNDIWMTTILSLKRNLGKFKFPAKLDTEIRQQIVELVGKELLASAALSGAKLFKSEECDAFDKEFLFEHFLSSQSYMQAHNGEAFVLEQGGSFMATVNVGNHVELIQACTDKNLDGCLSTLIQVETHLGEILDYAFSPTFGFLTSVPAHCGTGLKARIFLQLPATLHTEKLEEAKAKHLDEEISITGITGDPNDFIGDLVVISNNFSLGVTEEEILTKVSTLATQLMVEEKGIRAQLKQDADTHVKDLVSRAYGLLMHSYNLETFESLNALSLAKLGHELGWLQGVSDTKFNELFFNCRRAHLSTQLGEDVPQDDLAHRRAQFIQKSLSRLKLKL